MSDAHSALLASETPNLTDPLEFPARADLQTPKFSQKLAKQHALLSQTGVHNVWHFSNASGTLSKNETGM